MAGDLDGSISIPLFAKPDGWRIKLTAYAESKYGPRSTTVMQEAWSRTWDGPSYPLRDVLEKKASRYGQLGMPYVIAVNSSDMMHGDRDFQDTLFGSPPQFAAPGSPPDIGFWGTAASPKHNPRQRGSVHEEFMPADPTHGPSLCLPLSESMAGLRL